ncbi:hypothetical protein RGQ30_25430 [Limnobacter thiooxidans]|uniref:Uncharacterized protein n=1 Tax=Limnobacter thiooxidans TaxID=131080 RepID=A0AA86MJ46_9BURK|nr:hypothetical protein RGQ30_25430 [Limnobacter thiooxidans]
MANTEGMGYNSRGDLINSGRQLNANRGHHVYAPNGSSVWAAADMCPKAS